MTPDANSTNGGDVRIVSAGPEHLDGMARCHVACFPDLFTSRMGRRFGAAFYRAYLQHPEGLAFVAVGGEGQVVGLVAGGHPRIRARFLCRARRRFIGRLLWKGLTDKVVRDALREHMAGRSHQEPSERPEPGEKPGAGLQVICVLNECRGTGVAGLLMAAFRNACRDRGYRAVDLSVAADNARAIAFYLKHGWQVVRRDPRMAFMRLVLAA